MSSLATFFRALERPITENGDKGCIVVNPVSRDGQRAYRITAGRRNGTIYAALRVSQHRAESERQAA